MNLDFAVLFPVGAIAFYIIDAAMMLYANELVLCREWNGWSFSAGSEGVVLGRRPYLPNILFPQEPLFRVHWENEGSREPQEDAAALSTFFAALRPVQWASCALVLLLLIGLPAISLALGPGRAMLALFVVYYLLLLMALVWIYWRRSVLGLSRRAFWKLFLDACACAPFAVNLVRRISIHRSISGDPILFAKGVLPASAFANLVELIEKRLTAEEQSAAEGTVKPPELDAFRARLRSLAQ
jgi:hypothetical protein